MSDIRCAYCSINKRVDTKKEPKSVPERIAFFAKNGIVMFSDWINKRTLFFCSSGCEKKFRFRKQLLGDEVLHKTKRGNV